MSNRRTTNAKALERALLQAAACGDGPEVYRLSRECRKALTHAELADALGRMSWALGVFAGRVPAVERQLVTSELVNAEAILAAKGIKP